MAKEKSKLVEVKQVVDKDAREKALEDAIALIHKDHGKGSVMRLGDRVKTKVDVISTGSLAIDLALGIGGVPRGRIVEVYGPESSGKTTLTLHIIAEAQKNDGEVAFIDAEHALDPSYAEALGVDTDRLIVSQPDTGEQALAICDALARSGAVDVIIIDSVAALVPRSEIEGEMGESAVGLQARLMSQALRKLAGVINKSNTCVIFTNQLRDKIGVMYGSPETTTGGKALKFFASIRIDIRRVETLKEEGVPVGSRTRAKIVKNKLAPPFKEVEFDIMYGKGISHEGDVLDFAVENGIVEKSGTWFSYGDLRLGQGRDNAKKYILENPDFAEEIEEKIMKLNEEGNLKMPSKSKK